MSYVELDEILGERPLRASPRLPRAEVKLGEDGVRTFASDVILYRLDPEGDCVFAELSTTNTDHQRRYT